MNYYNEFDKNAALWLSQLADNGLIPAGHIDTRSISEVVPSDLAGYTQCHFFAGIGGWPLALRLAHWPESRPVWTGSCPCQPFSTAGRQQAFDDPRHLWPVWQKLVAQCRPPTLFGEQVGNALGRLWLAGVRTDLEALGYAFGAADLCSACVGAPNIRQRSYWLANRLDARPQIGRAEDSSGIRERFEREQANPAISAEITKHGFNGGRLADPQCSERRPPASPGNSEQHRNVVERQTSSGPRDGGATLGLEHPASDGRQQRRAEPGRGSTPARCLDSGLASSSSTRLQGHAGNGDDRHQPGRLDPEPVGPTSAGSESGRLVLANGAGSQPGQQTSEAARHRSSAEPTSSVSRLDHSCRSGAEQPERPAIPGSDGAHDRVSREDGLQSPLGFWSGHTWHYCRDDKHRRIPLESAFFPLAPRLPGRVALLKGYGNAINPQIATEFIRASLEVI